MLAEFFQLSPLPANEVTGSYDMSLVLLSYLVATAASYIALDIAGCLRDDNSTKLSRLFWLIGGSIAMGAGIWSMHFIGMLAFIMPMPMDYDPYWTLASLVVAVVASFLALFLLKDKQIKRSHLILGGVLLGIAIVSMHYIGMHAMKVSMDIHYLPGLFFLSIVIAIVASEVALWLAVESNKGTMRHRIRLKLISAVIMGAAICGMHYTGMAAAVFTPYAPMFAHGQSINPNILSVVIAVVTFCLLGIALVVSSYKNILNNQMIYAARQAGMAEVAVSVLHNIGNVLNSVNMSASIVKEYIDNSEMVNLAQVSKLIDEHSHDLADFLTKDPKGSLLPNFLSMLGESWKKEKTSISTELQLLSENINHIKNILAVQQTLSKVSNFEEIVQMEEVLEEALAITNANFVKHQILIEKKYAAMQAVMVDKIKLLQILINILQNAKDSLVESGVEPKKIIIEIGLMADSTFFVKITDNGIGIKQENLSKIFMHGFTTKMKGHGFGLHTSALSAGEMGGELKAESPGLGNGASFILQLPYKKEK